MSKHFQILIIGGGTAGIMVASQLLKKNNSIKIGLLDSSKNHWCYLDQRIC